MRTTVLGKTNLPVSRLGFGGSPLGNLASDAKQAAEHLFFRQKNLSPRLPIDRQRATKLLNGLLDAGVNLIDTAAQYQDSEEMIAQAIGSRRGQFVLVSKCGTKLADVAAEPWSAEMVSQTIDRSLRRLKTDVLDIMLLHSCDLQTLQKGEALGALVKARAAGKIRFAGYSGDNEAAAYAASHPDVAVIETSINIVDQANIDMVLPVAGKNNVGVLAKRPIANAAWKELSQQPGMYANYARTYTERFQKMGLKLAELGLGPDAPATWAEIALRFTLSQSGVHSAIVGTTNPANAQSNLAAAAKGPLPAEVVEKIRAAFARAQGQDQWIGKT
jgi:aryl-alcohol dehydrogenase-like predicted oxidoreductase